MLCASFFQIILLLCIASVISANVPILMWHGLLANPKSDFNFMKSWIKNSANGSISIKSIDLNINQLDERQASVFVHPFNQIDNVCNEIMRDDELKNGFNAIGFSQGGQFMRGLIQRCPGAKVKNFISFGGQHQGIYGIPNCIITTASPCGFLRKFLNMFAYTEWAQNHIAQATYWHDPINIRKYRKFSTFIADINNERSINKDYVYRLQRLNKFALVKFLRDEMVQPIETQWFGFYRPGSDTLIQNLTESDIYKSDKLGLRKMMENEKLMFLEIDDEHLNISYEWFMENIMPLLIED